MGKSITQYQVEFLTQLSRFDERNSDGKRRVDMEPDYLMKVIEDIKREGGPLWFIQKIRQDTLRIAHFGKVKKKGDFYQAAFHERNKKDIIFFANHFAWLINPWLTKYGISSKLPFVLFPKQEEYLLWKEDLYQKNKSGLVYKCREVGLSWLNALSQAYHWLYEPGFQGRLGSRKTDLVDDKNNPDALLWKVRNIIYNCPEWMRPKPFINRDNKYDNLLKLVNPENGAVITGEGGDNMGVGGRASMYDCDEWALVQHDKAVDAALSNNCRCVFYTSTPRGMTNDFAEKFHSGKVPVFSIDWWDDPRKSKDWYENFKEEHAEDITAQEVDKRWDAFKQDTCVPPDWVDSALKLYDKIKSGELQYDSDDRVCGLDVAAGGKNRSVLVKRRGILVEECLEYNIGNTTLLVEKVGAEAEKYGAHTVNFDPIAVGVGARSTFELRDFAFVAVPVDVRNTASDKPLEGDTRMANERCGNKRAELAVRLRTRFEKTYEYMENGTQHPVEELIAICPNHKLRTQLSVPELFQQNGKYRLEPKAQMVRRGLDSPDYFDSCYLSFADDGGNRVIASFNKNKKRATKELDIPWSLVNMRQQALHYVSIHHGKDLSVSVIGGLWWSDRKNLSIYGEFTANNPTMGLIMSKISEKFSSHAEIYEYLGNKEIFGGKNEEDSLFMQYMDYGLIISQNIQYNEVSAIAQIEAMVQNEQIEIDSKCTQTLGQISDWDLVRGSPDKTGTGLALGLCTMVNHLQELGKFEEKKDYRRKPYERKQVKQEVTSKWLKWV